ncbi:hypothetical protein JCM11251_003664 [Rhodosporidiobolus azoricus]
MAASSTHSPTRTLDDDEKRDYASSGSASQDGGIVTEKSRGVVQMERLNTRLTTPYRALLYISFALLAYVMSLDQYTYVWVANVLRPLLPGCG